LHNHVLPWTDRPLVTRNLAGGEDGINDAGISVARLIPNRWLFLEATGQVFRGDSDEVFKSVERSNVSVVGHLRGYRDISDASNIDLGFSVAHGHNGELRPGDTQNGDFTTTLYGMDATFRWRPLQRAIYHSFVIGAFMKVYRFVSILAAMCVAAPALAQGKLNVMASTEDLAAICREVAGDRASVDFIARGYQDPHFVEAKPSFILKLQRADL